MDPDHDPTLTEGTTRRALVGVAGALALAGAMDPLTPNGHRSGGDQTQRLAPPRLAPALSRLYSHARTIRRDGSHRRDREGAGHAVRADPSGATGGGHDGVHPRPSAQGDRRQTADLEVLDPGRRL